MSGEGIPTALARPLRGSIATRPSASRRQVTQNVPFKDACVLATNGSGIRKSGDCPRAWGSCCPFHKLRGPRNFLGTRRRPTAFLRQFKESHLPKLGVYLLCPGEPPHVGLANRKSTNPWLCEGRSGPFRFGFLISAMEMVGTLWGWWGVGERGYRANRRPLSPLRAACFSIGKIILVLPILFL